MPDIGVIERRLGHVEAVEARFSDIFVRMCHVSVTLGSGSIHSLPRKVELLYSSSTNRKDSIIKENFFPHENTQTLPKRSKVPLVLILPFVNVIMFSSIVWRLYIEDIISFQQISIYFLVLFIFNFFHLFYV